MKLNYLRHRGVLEWVIQRVSAILLGAYTVWILGFLLTHPELDFESWQTVFKSPLIRVFSFVTLVGLCAHLWIGMWTVITDYITPLHLGSSAKSLQRLCQLGIAALICFYLIWGVFVLWSI
jgi:succinate dehydrogenase / fumarate reductase membrane anchor subunit